MAGAVVLSAAVILCGTAAGGSFIGFANPAVVWNLRLPRVILAFITGGALAVSGAVFQSVLKNQLASPYILGVSSGASLGAALVMAAGAAAGVTAVTRVTAVTGVTAAAGSLFRFGAAWLGSLTLPLAGFVFGVGTVFLVILLASRLDSSLSNNTIILFGMVFSLFINAILTTMLALFREELKNLLIWQLGSFALRGWNSVWLMIPFLITGMAGIIRYIKEMDILSFGEDEARSLGVDARRVRTRLFLYAALLTGAAVALSGVIGFVDLIAPHIARRITGSNHRYVLPMSFFAGGILMVLSDLAARIIISPSELPVGAVTALIGAPFFAWIYFRRPAKRRSFR
jgi:iron complex transport system permease protein